MSFDSFQQLPSQKTLWRQLVTPEGNMACLLVALSHIVIHADHPVKFKLVSIQSVEQATLYTVFAHLLSA